eukprot:Em0009g219a
MRCANALCKCAVQMRCANALCKCAVQMRCANALCKCAVQMRCANALCKCAVQTSISARCKPRLVRGASVSERDQPGHRTNSRRISANHGVLCSDFTIILRQNDYYPMFSQKVYSVTYNDSTPPGQVIPSICTDQDIGVGALQGALTTNISMDYTRARGCTVVLLCSDTGGLTNTSTVYVTITPHPNYTPLAFSSEGYVSKVSRTTPPLYIIGQIMAADAIIWSTTLTYKLQSNPYFIIDRLNGNLNSPVFTPGERSFDINELSPIGTSVATFQCTDADNGTNGQISYSIPGGNIDGAFQINQVTGIVQVANLLILPQNLASYPYQITIQCSDHGVPIKSNCMFIFNPTILDTTAVGSTVLQLSCSDADSGLSEVMLYSHSTNYGLLGISNDTGAINLSSPDSISYSVLNFTMHISDRGSPTLNILSSSSSSLSLFTNHQCSYTYQPLLISAIAYNLGLNYVNAIVSDTFPVPIRIISVTVYIFVQPVNTFFPVFQQSLYSYTIPENSPIGVTDHDSPASPDGQVTYSLIGLNQPKFTIDRSGWIILTSNLDILQQAVYNFTVLAMDGGKPPRTGGLLILIDLLNMNGGSTGSCKMVDIVILAGQLLYRVTPQHSGSGEYCGGRGSILETYYGFLIVSNASVTISVIEVDNVLTMSARCSAYALVVEKMTLLAGILLLFTACDLKQAYTTSIALSIIGNIVLSSVALATSLFPSSSSDKFAISSYLDRPNRRILGWTLRQMSVEYDQVQETTAITVWGVAPSPRPPDGFLTVRCINGSNSSVGMTYTIGQVNRYFPFVLNSTTGSFSVTQDLVYATQPHSYNFSVWCYDNLSPNLSSNASVTISVIEVDKYKPVITPSYVFLTVNETTPLGTVLASTRRDVGALSVYNATDMDVGPQGVLYYNNYYPDPRDRFTVDGTFGTLTVHQSLNIAATTFVNLIIHACDPHVCSSDFNVYITILCQNDHYPMFSQKVYSITYNDSTPPGQMIPSICTDQDIGVGALQGVVFLNTTPGVFLLNASTGVLTTNISMDYRRARGYTVVLLCSDTGGLTNTSTVYVTITPPLIFSNAIYVFHILRSTPSPYTVGQVMATDFFTVLLTYSLTNNPYFIIDSHKGTIQTISSVFDYPYSEIVLNATVTDGLYNDTAMVYFILMDTNSPSPSPLLPTNTTQAEQTMIYIVAGIIAAAVLVNTEFKPNESVPNVFNIDANTGVVRVAAHLDHDTVPVCTMTVVAIWSVDPARNSSALLTIISSVGAFTATSTLSIYVLNTNKYDPMCLSTLYVVNVPENATVQTVLTNLSCSDANKGPGAQLVYTIVAGNDTFPVPRIISVTVYIFVQPVNTFSLVFQQFLYSYTIPENSSIGASVFLVTATDGDRPASPDGQVTYSLIGLNQPKFTVERSGWIILASNLDILQQAVYNFMVLAMDGGKPPRTGSASVVIYVGYVGIRPPQFTQSLYYTALNITNPFTLVGSVVLTVHFTDPVLGIINYSLDPSLSSSRYFNVDPNSGVITIKATLPSSSGHLTFRAICTGSAPYNLSDTAVMDVELLVKSNITFIPSASCLFLPPHTYNCGYDITYSLINYQLTFSIDPSSGYFRLIGMLEYEQQQVYVVPIQASLVGPLGSDMAQATILVYVDNLNDHQNHHP